MKALVMFKRINTAGVTQILAEIRPYGCYNGFNTSNAFAHMPQYTDFIADLSAQGDMLLGTIQSGQVVREGAGELHTGWECLGIGWVSERAANSYDTTVGGPGIGRGHEMVMLNRETFFDQYYDSNNDRWIATKRERTPNEIFAGRALNVAYRAAWNGSNAAQAIKDSQVLRVLFTTHYYGGYMDMDFVGSERSSGMAVAYLQVYRNSSRLFCNVNNNTDVRDTLLYISGQPGVKSMIPFLSALTHGGGDSDIFSHTNGESGLVTAQAAVHGIFSLQPYMERQTSMLQEGRYAKGNQSAALGNNIRRAYREAGRTQINHEGWADVVGSLTSINSARRNLSGFMNMLNMTSMGRSSFMATLNQRMDTYFAAATPQSAADTVTRLIRSMILPVDQRNGTPANTYWDLRTPVRPIPVPRDTTRVAGAAQGFSQWVAATDARFGDTTTRQQTAADVARSNAAGVPV